MNWFSKALTAMRHTPRPMFVSRMLRRTRFDYRREVGDGLDSSVVTAPIRWVQRAFPEARLVVRRRKRNGSIEEMIGHPMLALIQLPNPYYDDIALWGATLLSWYLDGNAYWIKVRNRAGRPVELWYVPHWMMKEKAPEDGSEFLSHYLYSPGSGIAPMILDPEDVVHFRDGIDPRDPKRGLAALDGVIREIFIDLESSNFVASLLRNMGVPGVVISPKGGAMPMSEDVAATKAWFQESFGGDRRGGALVMGAPTDVQPYGFNPQQMNMSEGRDVAEERVCAVIGIPAAVVGFGAGLQTAKVGATMQEMHKIAWLSGVLPVGRAFAGALGRSLLPDFGDPTGQEVGWNTDEVLALQEDEAKQVERWNKMLDSGGITLFEWRQGLGMDANDSHRIYLRRAMVLEVPEGAAPRVEGANGGPSAEPSKGARGTKAARASEAGYKRGEAYALTLQRQNSGLSAAFEKALSARFARWGEAARAAALPLLEAAEPKQAKATGQKADDALTAAILEKLGLEAWVAELTQDYGAHYLEVANAVQDAAERAGLGTNLPDAVARAIVASGGRRVGLIDVDKQTREAIFEALAEGRAEGEGVKALADRIGVHVEAGPWNAGEIRARLIARTETKYAQNISTIERGRAAGVEQFVVFDGRLGPGRSVPEHILRNGSIVDTDAAVEMAANEHPNGTLSFAPYFEE
ncbi:phage portal protein [Sphingomonas sp. ERG5]|uniref:phage portal protein n=1 Tax=Sphingomonas sp. ERG5 TaxID=1381597 RepID=UPI00054B6F8A|nr:phage portal protein [Sphingomonas sp. ERG5]